MQMFKLLFIAGISVMFHTSSFSLSFESNESKQRKWEEVLSKQTELGKACLNVGIQKKQLKVNSTDPNAEIASITDPAAKEIFATCDKFLTIQLRKDFSCNTKDGGKGMCSDRYCYEKDGKKLFATGIGAGAMRAMFDGISVSTCPAENEDTKAERLAATQANKEAAEKAEAERIAEEKRKQEYMNSPAYKKEQEKIAREKAAEEKKQLAEEQKRQAEAAKQQQADAKAKETEDKKRQAEIDSEFLKNKELKKYSDAGSCVGGIEAILFKKLDISKMGKASIDNSFKILKEYTPIKDKSLSFKQECHKNNVPLDAILACLDNKVKDKKTLAFLKSEISTLEYLFEKSNDAIISVTNSFCAPK